MPRVFGDSLLHISEADALGENDVRLSETPEAPISREDRIIATTIAAMIDDGSCLQMGIGSLPNAVCAMLNGRKDLGIHTELMTPALARLVECGAVTNRRKATYPGRSDLRALGQGKGVFDEVSIPGRIDLLASL